MPARQVDPITLLKESFSTKQRVSLKNTVLHFPNNVVLRLETKTAFVSSDSKRQYTVGDLWLFLDSRANSLDDRLYFTRLTQLKKDFDLRVIEVTDRENVENFFTGRTDNCYNVNETLRELIQTEQVELRKRNIDDFKSLITNYEELKAGLTVDDQQINTILYLKQNERPDGNASSRQRCSKDFTFCLDIMQNNHRKTVGSGVGKKEIVIGHKDNVISRLLNSKGNSIERVKPIIIVPNTRIRGNINLVNGPSFINDGQYKEASKTENLKKQVFCIDMKILDTKLTFEVWDDISYLRNKKRLHQVVAIFIDGSPYQFKNCKQVWKVNSIARLFKKVRGYHLRYSDTQPHSVVKNWNIKELILSKNAKHKDSVVSGDFANDLKKFLLSRAN